MSDELDPEVFGELLGEDDEPSEPSVSEAAAEPSEEPQYPIVEVLGTHVQGATYRCTDPGQPERVVVQRRIKQDLSQQHPDLVTAGLAPLGRLAHRGLALVEDVGWEGDEAFLVREYVEGKPLLQALASASLEEILQAFHQLLQTLAYLDAQNVLHLNLTPENIFSCSKSGQVKVTDYGLYPLFHHGAGGPAQPLQVSPYTAPEYAKQGHYDSRSDLYSFAALFSQALREKKPSDSKLPPKLQNFIKRCSAENPKKRYQHVREALQALAPLVPTSDSGLDSFKEEIPQSRWVKMFRRIFFQGHLWAFQGAPGSGKTFFARWLQRYFWRNRKQVKFFQGSDLVQLQGDTVVHPSEPLFVMIDEADHGPVQAWLENKPYQHVMIFGEDLSWAKEDRRWQFFSIEDLNSDFQPTGLEEILNSLDKSGRSLLLSLTLVQVPLSVATLASILSEAPESLRATLLSWVPLGWVQRRIWKGQEFFQARFDFSQSMKSFLSEFPVQNWVKVLEELGWVEAAATLLDQTVSQAVLEQDSALRLQRASLDSALGEHPKVLKSVTSEFVHSLSPADQGKAFEVLGRSLLGMGKKPQAEAAAKKAFSQYGAIKNVAGQVRLLLLLGAQSRQDGNQSRALQFFEKALSLAKQTSDKENLLGEINLAVAEFYEQATDFARAEERYSMSAQHFFEASQDLGMARAYLGLAHLDWQQGNPETAAYDAEEAIHASSFQQNLEILGKALLLLAQLEEANGNPHLTRQYLGEAIFYLSQRPSLLYGQALIRHASFLALHREVERAQADGERALQLAKALKDYDLLGQSYWVLGKVLGRDEKKSKQALQYLDRAQQALEKANHTAMLWECAFEKGEVERHQGNASGARTHYETALQLITDYEASLEPSALERFRKTGGRERVEMALKWLG